MKVLVLLGLSFLSSAFASTIDTFTLPLYSLNQEEHFSLMSTKTRTQYRYETVERTCTRTEFDGYRNVCGFETEIVCEGTHGPHRPGRDPHPGRGRDHGGVDCRPKVVYRCHQEPVYRTVNYSCNQTITVPYEVVDHEVRANVHLNVNRQRSSMDSFDPNCNLKYTLDGDSLRAAADCSSVLVYADSKKQSEVDRFGNVTHFYDVELTLIDAKTRLAPVNQGIEEMRLEGQTLTFRTGDLTKNPNFTMNLFIERKRFLKSDETIISRSLSRNEFSFDKINENQGIVKINLDKLFGGINTGKKHEIKVDLSVSLPAGNLLNSVLPVTSARGELRVNH